MHSLQELLEPEFLSKKTTIAVVSAEDHHVLEALKLAVSNNIVIPILIGNSIKIRKISEEISFDISDFELIDIQDNAEAASFGVNIVKTSKANVLMKGLISTGTLMKAVLHNHSGLLKHSLLSHVSVNQIPGYSKLLVVSDAAMNIKPTVDDKIEIIRNAVNVCNKIGIVNPKVALLCPIEYVNKKIESTVDASIITEKWKTGEIPGCIIDGPLALDNAINTDAAILKGIQSSVAGDADVLITHDLDSGNILYKSLNFMANGNSAAIIVGASAPIILTSRSDSAINKLYSIALACKMAN
jgi:phosphate butyryltransferase